MSSSVAPPPAALPERPDADLVRAVAGGDEQALAELYDRHAARMHGCVLRVVQNRHDAEEILLIAFLQIWRTASTFDERRGSVVAWMITIARTRALDAARALRRRAHYEPTIAATSRDTAGAQAVDDLFELVSENERSLAVRSAMRSLPAAQREAIELAFFYGYSHAEIATLRLIPLGTVKSRIRQGMERLRAALSQFEST